MDALAANATTVRKLAFEQRFEGRGFDPAGQTEGLRTLAEPLAQRFACRIVVVSGEVARRTRCRADRGHR